MNAERGAFDEVVGPVRTEYMAAEQKYICRTLLYSESLDTAQCQLEVKM